jgi:hypothetical protein
MEDVVDPAHVERLANVFFYKLESGLVAEMFEVGAAAGEQVVDDDHIPAFGEQSVAEMGS